MKLSEYTKVSLGQLELMFKSQGGIIHSILITEILYVYLSICLSNAQKTLANCWMDLAMWKCLAKTRIAFSTEWMVLISSTLFAVEKFSSHFANLIFLLLTFFFCVARGVPHLFFQCWTLRFGCAFILMMSAPEESFDQVCFVFQCIRCINILF